MGVISKSLKTKFKANTCPSGEQVPLAGDAAHLRRSLRRESLGWHLPRRAGQSLLAVLQPLHSCSILPTEGLLFVGAIFVAPCTFFMCKCNFLPSGLLYAMLYSWLVFRLPR